MLTYSIINAVGQYVKRLLNLTDKLPRRSTHPTALSYLLDYHRVSTTSLDTANLDVARYHHLNKFEKPTTKLKCRKCHWNCLER